MSLTATQWAWQQTAPTSAKFILVLMADMADMEGICWPSKQFLGEKTGLTPRSVQRAIGQLVELGLLEATIRVDQFGRQRSNCYQLLGGIIEDQWGGDKLSPRGRHRISQGGDTESPLDPLKKDPKKCSSSLRSEELVPSERSSPPAMTFPVGKNGSEWPLSEAKLREYREAYPAIDVPDALRRAKQYLIDNPLRRKTARGMPRYLNSWLGRERSHTVSRPMSVPDRIAAATAERRRARGATTIDGEWIRD